MNIFEEVNIRWTCFWSMGKPNSNEDKNVLEDNPLVMDEAN